MANDEYGYFWNSNEHDRVYDADSFSNWLRKFFTTGVFQNDLQVTANGGLCRRKKRMEWIEYLDEIGVRTGER